MNTVVSSEAVCHMDPMMEMTPEIKDLEVEVKKEIQHVLYCNFYITPKFAY